MNAAFVQWLMAPERPDEDLAIEDFLRRPTWHARAACRGMGTDVFFPGRGEVLKVRAAKAVCDGCSVREECLDAALDGDDTLGIWGGVSERRRRGLRRGAVA
jgi:WhiB family redox-sensing transcriptional regulator